MTCSAMPGLMALMIRMASERVTFATGSWPKLKVMASFAAAVSLTLGFSRPSK